jgi:hypothetical protein
MRRSALYAACLFSCSLTAGGARAFSEPLLYSEDPMSGGGGGRFFTGSPLDAYSCAVCHQGAEPPTVRLSGFPTSFVPGKTYDINLTWTHPAAPHGLNLEIVDPEGRAAGEIALPAPDSLTADDRCTFTEDELLKDTQASYVVASETRRIVGVRACGARSLRFAFTAPRTSKVALTAAVVRSDESDDVSGDGVLELRQIAYRSGEPVPSAGCAVRGSDRAFSPWAVLWALLGAQLFRRRRHRSDARCVTASRG